MANRIHAQLARWVRLGDTALAGDLAKIGADISPDALQRARRLFARVLDAPGGGLRIQTIHSFCQTLLAGFPVEAGVAPGFRPIEERERRLLARTTLAGVLADAERQGDQRLRSNLEALSLRLGADAAEAFLLRCAAAPEAMTALRGAIQPLVQAALGLPRGFEAADLVALCGDAAIDRDALEAIASANRGWGTNTGNAAADAISGWLALADAGRLAAIDDLAAQFFTKTGDRRKLRDQLTAQRGDYPDLVEAAIAAIGTVTERRALLGFADFYARALELGRAFAYAFDTAKRRAGMLDFDDQIRLAAALLSDPDQADWIRYKLDQRFDHILVDESQDTNASQWAIVAGLVSDFFAGAGAKPARMRTLFTVGDFKQAIFGFQGTSPEAYAAAQLFFSARAREAGPDRAFAGLSLDRSFRTTAPVLALVDAVIGALGPAALGIDADAVPRHEPRPGPGAVTLWPPVRVADADGDEQDTGEADGAEPDGAETWLSRGDRLLAKVLAERVLGWIAPGSPDRLWLARRGDGTPGWARAGDVMILLRKRADLAGLIVARLHALGVPVAGIDRLRLGAPLAVKDLIAAIRFALQPLDDLNLAALLVSPLIGWSQEELLAFGYRKPRQRLWPHLRARAVEDPAFDARLLGLRSILAMADLRSPYMFLETLLSGPIQGRARLVARLGAEALDPIGELLQAALRFGAEQDATLQQFLHWFEQGDEEIKRELSEAGDAVRVLTVHGAKGLQAPVVVLADCCVDPAKADDKGFDWPIETDDGRRIALPLYRLRKEERIGPLAEAHAEHRAAALAEHWRLLYVALTRAEERLYLIGSLNAKAKTPPPDSWYAALAAVLAGMPGADVEQDNGMLSFGSPARPPLDSDAAVSETPMARPYPLPDWALVPAEPESRPPRPLAPSSIGSDDVASPPGDDPQRRQAAARGIAMHALFERLPAVPPDDRRARALDWLARQSDFADDDARAAIADAVLAIIADPRWADLFGPDALAEVPVAALVGDTMIAGTVDRLLIRPDRVRIVDFKTTRRPPADAGAVPMAYVRQMAAYRAALGIIYPGRRIEAALLYTERARMIVLPDALLDTVKLD